MSRLSGDAVVVQDAADKLADVAGALDALAAGIAGDATALASLVASTGKISTPATLAPGTGADGMDMYRSWVEVVDDGSLFKTSILVDIDGLVSAATANDIIGETGGAANAHIGQITAAANGTVFAGLMTCLQTPAGGEVDIDLSESSIATGAQSADVTGLTDYAALLAAGADWTAGTSKGLTVFPTADHYLYLSVGTASSPAGGTYTAGIFLIELWGQA